MKTMQLSNFALSLVLAGSTCVLAQDWPQWLGANRDGKVAGFSATDKWPANLTQKWKAKVGLGDATPALVGNRLYVFARQGDEEIVLCLSAEDGKEVWQQKYTAQAVTGPASPHAGPRSSPTVANGKVVVLGVGGVLTCLDAATGKVLWQKDEFPKVVPNFFAAMSPIVVDGLCIAQAGGKGNGAAIAYDLASGSEKWRAAGDGPAYGSPVVMTVAGVKQVVVQTEKNLMGLAIADGKVLWQVATPTARMAQNAATPVVEGQMVFYTGQGQGTHAVKVEKEGDGFTAKPVWANDKLGTTFNTPVLKNGLLFGLSDRGNLFCLKADSGETAWTDTNQRDRFGTVLDTGSSLVVLPASKSELVAFKPSPQQFEEVARLKVADSPTYATPVLAGNRIFVKDAENVTLWTLP